MPILCVLTESVTQRSPGLLVTKLCQVSPSLNVAYVHLVLLGTQAVVEGAQLPGGQLAHFWGKRHEGHIPTGTSVSAATQNNLFQMDDLCHQQHEIIPGRIGLSSFCLPTVRIFCQTGFAGVTMFDLVFLGYFFTEIGSFVLIGKEISRIFQNSLNFYL